MSNDDKTLKKQNTGAPLRRRDQKRQDKKDRTLIAAIGSPINMITDTDEKKLADIVMGDDSSDLLTSCELTDDSKSVKTSAANRA